MRGSCSRRNKKHRKEVGVSSYCPEEKKARGGRKQCRDLVVGLVDGMVKGWG